MSIAANEPPQDQDLQITWTLNGIPIGKITLQSTDTVNVFVSELFDPATPIYAYRNDSLNATALYINIGSNPVAARGVTVTVSHQI
jgi:hypothetical protein